MNKLNTFVAMSNEFDGLINIPLRIQIFSREALVINNQSEIKDLLYFDVLSNSTLLIDYL